MRRAVVVRALTACGACTTYRTKRIATPGKTEWLFGAQLSGARTEPVAQGNGGAAPVPELALGARRGLDERTELQLNGTLLPTSVARAGSVELAGKLRLLAHGRWSLAVAAGAGYRFPRRPLLSPQCILNYLAAAAGEKI